MKQDYEKMSDLQLSLEILKFSQEDSLPKLIDIYDETIAIMDISTGPVSFDINNPTDIMPLVIEAGISLICRSDEGTYIAEFNRFDDYRSFDHKNPYRAAAVVWLMMNEGEG